MHHEPPLAPAAGMGDAQLRRELADTHLLAQVVDDCWLPQQRQALESRLAELDAEYLRRFPQARANWPWPLPVHAGAQPA